MDLGFENFENFISDQIVNEISDEISKTESHLKSNSIRNAEKKLKSVSNLVKSKSFRNKVSPYFSDEPNLIKAIIFNKSIQRNWFVKWHQDKTIAVSKRICNKHWKLWNLKDGFLNVQPPTSILKNIVTFRIHLDNSTRETGCLKVLPKSHLFGLLSESKILNLSSQLNPVYCEGKKGSILVMKPLLIHASEKLKTSAQRKVLHLEFSDTKLPEGLEWA